MSMFEEWRPISPGFDPQRAFNVQVGALSPLWFPMMGAVACGLALWSFNRWMSLACPEGVLEADAPADSAAGEAESKSVPPEILAIDPVSEAPVVVAPEPESAPPAETKAETPAPAASAPPRAAAPKRPKAAGASPAPAKGSSKKPRPTAH